MQDGHVLFCLAPKVFTDDVALLTGIFLSSLRGLCPDRQEKTGGAGITGAWNPHYNFFPRCFFSAELSQSQEKHICFLPGNH